MSANFAPLKILLVDDNKHMRSIIAAILEGVGVREVREASDGAEALKIMREWPVDMVIADFLMSPMNGVDFTRKVRQGKSGASAMLPIIMMTGYAERARVFEARDAGVTEMLVKPVTARAVLSRVSEVIYKPRTFVRTPTYFGPCRRRRVDPHYHGEKRRREDLKTKADVTEI
jgi:CheY-like chemotaxis protein